MNIKTFLKISLVIIVVGFAVFILLFSVIIGVISGFGSKEQKIETNYEVATTIRNNSDYAMPYKRVINKHLTKGYVSLERIVFYLQRTNNVLDVSLLGDSKWEEAYLSNLNLNEKQMIPIGQVCNALSKNENLPNFNIQSDERHDVIDLCLSDDSLNNSYKELPYYFPLNKKFTVTSFTNEERIINGKHDIHNGWDLAVPVGTNFYSVCDGMVSKIVNSQPNDLPYKYSKNSIGNYIKVKCDNGLTSIYYHIKYKSNPKGVKENVRVKAGDLLGKTSTTGYSTGPHLHLGLIDVNKNVLDVMEYVNFTQY